MAICLTERVFWMEIPFLHVKQDVQLLLMYQPKKANNIAYINVDVKY